MESSLYQGVTLVRISNFKFSKTCVNLPLSKRLKIGFRSRPIIAKCRSKVLQKQGSILQYFRPSLSYHLRLRSLFCLFLSGRFTQVLLYVFLSLKITNSADPDEMLCFAAYYLGLHCLPKYLFMGIQCTKG